MTHADIQQQTDINKRPLYHPDGKPKFVMIVPLTVAPSAEFPDGRAAWYVKGADRVELERAMETAGVKPGTPPEAGALITVTYVGDRPIPNMSPQKVKQVSYQRPAGANGNGNGHAQPAQQTPPPPSATAPAPGAAPATWAAPATATSPPQDVPFQPPYTEQPQPQYQQQAAPPPPPQFQPPPQPQFQTTNGLVYENPAPGVVAQPAQQYAAPDSLTPEQAQRLRELTGQ